MNSRSNTHLAVLVPLLLGATCCEAKTPKPVSPKRFGAAATAALDAMRSRATSLHIQGVAIVAFVPGAAVENWQSQMAVVGHLTDNNNGDKGNNLLAIAYAKAAEMANTLKNSGTSGKLPMTGEFGWQGGLIAQTSKGYVIAAFSGGKSEDDVQTSRAGLTVLQDRVK